MGADIGESYLNIDSNMRLFRIAYFHISVTALASVPLRSLTKVIFLLTKRTVYYCELSWIQSLEIFLIPELGTLAHAL